jgi:hypothetical protein
MSLSHFCIGGKVALITASSRGMARLCVEARARCMLTSRRRHRIWTQMKPMGRYGEAQEVANGVLVPVFASLDLLHRLRAGRGW